MTMNRLWVLLMFLSVACTSVPTSTPDPFETDASGSDMMTPPDQEGPDRPPPTEDTGGRDEPSPPPPDRTPVPPDRPAPPRDVPVPPPDVPLPTGGCTHLPTYWGSMIDSQVFSTRGGFVVNRTSAVFTLPDGTIGAIHQAVGALGGGPPGSPVELGVGANANNATCTFCSFLLFGCAIPAGGTGYRCSGIAFARRGTGEVPDFARSSGGTFSFKLYNVIYQEATIDPMTYVSSFVPGGRCFTLDEISLSGLASPPPAMPDGGMPADVPSTADAGPSRDATAPPATPPDMGTGLPEPGTGRGQRLLSGEGAGDVADAGAPMPSAYPVSYGVCGGSSPTCPSTSTSVCLGITGASPSTCTSECARDTDCPSHGTCVGPFSNGRNYCFRPCLAGGCSATGFACSSFSSTLGSAVSVCSPRSGAPSCTAPRTMCASCTDTSTDALNCGSCTVRCATGQTCTGGVCVARAGAACATPGGADPACGEGPLQCTATTTTPICTDTCENNASQTIEQSMCGGAGSTCLTQGDPPGAVQSSCTASCRAAGTTTATGACRVGNVCTGWWYTHAAGAADSTGCFPFCSEDSHCPAGMRCNPRTGACGATGADATRLPDGAPCNPRTTVEVPGSTTPRNVQCRGICFAVNSAQPTQGICGSFMNLRASAACPDEPTGVPLRASAGTDNLALCIWRSCARNSDCRSPHICRYLEQGGTVLTDRPPQCDYPTAAQRAGLP